MKKFITLTSILAFPFYLCIGIYSLCIYGKTSGDLGHLAEITFGKEYDKMIQNHQPSINFNVPLSDTTKINNYQIFNIGDSFSKQGKNGFQNHLGITINTPILNIDGKYSPEQKALSLLNSGALDNVSLVIIESVERTFIYRLNHLDFSHQETIQEAISNNYENKRDRKLSLDGVFRWININLNLREPVKKFQLNIHAFEHPELSDKLYCYYEDFNFINTTENDINNAVVNLKKLYSKFQEKNIKMVYLIAADKYDMYFDFITHTPYPKNNTLIPFNEINEEWIIDSKNILLPLIEKGEKDIYMLNDTHWSPIASKAIANELRKRFFSQTED